MLTDSQAVYKGVRSWTKHSLQRVGERVTDVPLPDDSEEEEEETETPKPMSDVKFKSEPVPGPTQTAQESTTSSSFVSDRTTLSCRAPANDTSISQCAKNDPDPS